MNGMSKNCSVSSRFRYTRLLRINPSRGISSAHSDSRYSTGDGNCPGRRLAITAALNPPAPVPQKTSGAGVPSAAAHFPLYIAFKTPTSYAALAPPPESTRPTRLFELRSHLRICLTASVLEQYPILSILSDPMAASQAMLSLGPTLGRQNSVE